MSSIIVYYPETLEVFEVIEDAQDIKIEPSQNAIIWNGGAFGGLELPFVILDEETSAEELKTLSPELIARDKSAEYVKEDVMLKLETKLKGIEKRLERMEGRTVGNANL